jgi:peroxiredoxin Q/BCP
MHLKDWMFSLLSQPLLEVGSTAPDFTARDQGGNEVSLSKLRGKNVVLVFYPHDSTPVCTKQLCEFRDNAPLAASKDTLVYGVNYGSGKSHSSFRERHRLPFPLIVDEENRLARLYHARGLLWVLRTVYLIGKDGRIRYARRGKPSPPEVLAAAS